MDVLIRKYSPYLGALVFLIAVFVPFPFGKDQPAIERLFDTAHLPLFGAVYLGLFLLLRTRLGFLAAVIFAIMLSIGAAIMVEIIQPTFGRSKSEMDILYGMLGISFTAALHVVWARLENNAFALFLCGGLLVLLPLVFRPVWIGYQASEWRKQHFPLLGDFENPLELIFWKASGEKQPSRFFLTSDWSSDGKRSLRIDTRAGDYSGVSYAAGKQSWSGFQTLKFDVYSPEDNVQLYVRIDDDEDCEEFEARFNTEMKLLKGKNEIRIPLENIATGPQNRRLNTDRIHRLMLFTGPDDRGRTLMFDSVQLE